MTRSLAIWVTESGREEGELHPLFDIRVYPFLLPNRQHPTLVFCAGHYDLKFVTLKEN